MTAKIIPKKSTVASKVPDSLDLEVGEVAINLTDAVFYAKHPDGSIVNLSGAPELHTHTISQISNLQSSLDGKVDKISGKGLSTEDYTTTEKNKLAGIESGAEVNVGTNLGQSRTATSYTVTSSTGSNTTLASATTTSAGVMTSSDKSKLNGIEAGATADQTKADIDALGIDADSVDGLQASQFLRSDITEREDISVTTGQTNISLSTITLKTTNPVLLVDGYMSKEQIIDYDIVTPTSITLTNPIEADGTLSIIQYT